MAEGGNAHTVSTGRVGGPGRHELSARQREKLKFTWSVKERVLRRLGCVVEPTKEKVVARAEQPWADRWDAASDVLAHAAGQPKALLNTREMISERGRAARHCLRAMRSDLLGRLAMGSTHRTVYVSETKSLVIALPSILEQQMIVSWLRSKVLRG